MLTSTFLALLHPACSVVNGFTLVVLITMIVMRIIPILMMMNVLVTRTLKTRTIM